MNWEHDVCKECGIRHSPTEDCTVYMTTLAAMVHYNTGSVKDHGHDLVDNAGWTWEAYWMWYNKHKVQILVVSDSLFTHAVQLTREVMERHPS